MILSKLIKGLDYVEVIGNTDCEINDIKCNSNSISKGNLFVCLNGNNYDAHNFVAQAEKYGCSTIVCEKKVACSVTQIIVKDTRKALCSICSSFYGCPDKDLRMIAVLGTNGKTTTAKLICDIINESGINCGFIGTPGTFYNGNFYEQDLTTPDPIEFYKILSDMVKNGVVSVVMEVSAHAVYYDKIYGINFEGAVFTNFTQDHLDFFDTMDEYKKCKMKFFNNYKCKYIVTNSDDEFGMELSKNFPASITYGIENPSDVFAIDLVTSSKNQSFIINLFDCIYELNINFIGKFNVYNVLAAATTTALFGVPTKSIIKAIEIATPVEGRLEKIYDDKFSVIIDYAHTPDGLENVLKTLRKNCDGRLICVFGCGGNRDSSKRKIMGAVSGENADFTVLTSDNPRYEEPLDIILEIEKGVLEKTKDYVIVQDREDAIKYALDYALDGDVVLIAGKGGEKYQEILGIKHPFNDKDTVNRVLGEK